jgi:GNAT superfamily N-acetyltransferase
MTAANTPAPGAQNAVVRAEAADLDTVSRIIAEAFHGLAVSEWLIPDPHARRQIFPAYFRIVAGQALAAGGAYTTAGRSAAALWIPRIPGQPEPEHDSKIEEVTGPWAGRFALLDVAMTARLPGFGCDHLAMLAVLPGHQRRGTGAALLAARHAQLDLPPQSPAYLQASSPESREFYLARGYSDHGPVIELPGGLSMYPMVRLPRAGHG